MKKKAIGQIIACSIVGVLLAGTLALLIGVLPKVDVIEPIRTAMQTVTDTIKRLPQVRFEPSISVGGESTDGYAKGNGVYDTVPEKLQIDWATGRIGIRVTDGQQVRLTEWAGNVNPDTAAAGTIDERYSMRHRSSGSVLKVQEFRSGMTLPDPEVRSKTLLVELPKAALKTLSIDAATVDLVLEGIDADTFDLDLATGTLAVSACTFQKAKMDIATANGSFDSCTIEDIDLDSAMAELTFDLLNAPKRIDADAATGQYRFMLPMEASFTVKASKIAGKVSVDGFDIASTSSDRVVVGDGAASYRFDLATGTISIEARTGNRF